MTTTDTSGTDEVTIDERDDAIETDDAVEMDPRIEARRDEVRREYAQKRLRILVIVAVVVVVLVGTYLVVESPFLDVDRVEVNGAVHVTPKQVRRAAAIDEGRALLRVDLDNVARRVEALPWVASASVHRDLPGTLRIDVHEARPLAFVRANGRVAVIGPGDRVVALTREPPAGAIEITGVRRVPDRDETMSPAGTSRVVSAMPAEMLPHARAIALRADTVAVVLDMGEVRLGDASHLPAKFAAAVAVMRTFNGAPFEYIDVSVPTDPVSKP
jgi:cell division protein FtsQ